MVKKVTKRKEGDYEWDEIDSSYAVCEQMSDIIQVVVEDFCHETEAYHLKETAKKHGYEYKVIEKDFDFDKEWDAS